jgi:DNA-binding NtrC family response regulator
MNVAVLVVDDATSMCRIVGGMLNGLGITDIDYAETLQGAQDCLDRREYRLVVADVFLGGETVEPLLARIDAMGEDRPSTIVMTGEPDKARAYVGFDVDCLVKPFTARQFAEKLERFIPIGAG